MCIKLYIQCDFTENPHEVASETCYVWNPRDLHCEVRSLGAMEKPTCPPDNIVSKCMERTMCDAHKPPQAVPQQDAGPEDVFAKWLCLDEMVEEEPCQQHSATRGSGPGGPGPCHPSDQRLLQSDEEADKADKKDKKHKKRTMV